MQKNIKSVIRVTCSPLFKEILWPRNWRGQIFTVAKYSSEAEQGNVAKPKNDTAEPRNEVKVPRNVHPLKDKYISSFQEGSGDVYDTKPFKIRLKPNKEYFWCLCGRSHSQPLCDGTHRDAYRKTPFRPVRFQVEEDKEYWLCNCKKTKMRPFCDGTHKTLPPKKR